MTNKVKLTVSTKTILPHTKQPGAGVPWAIRSTARSNFCSREMPAWILSATLQYLLFPCLLCHVSISLRTSYGPAGIIIRSKSLSGNDFLYVSLAFRQANIAVVSLFLLAGDAARLLRCPSHETGIRLLARRFKSSGG